MLAGVKKKPGPDRLVFRGAAAGELESRGLLEIDGGRWRVCVKAEWPFVSLR